MTDTIANRPAGPLSLSMDSFREVLKKPLLLLPEAVRPAALRLWTCNRHLAGLETSLPLAARLAVWIGEHGLTPGDASNLLDQMLSPEASARHRFASDLLADLASAVAERLKIRRSRREQAERDKQDAGQPASGFRLSDTLAGIGEMA